MITIKLTGGLGNQMFQYAAALALTKELDTSLNLNITEFEHYKLRDYMLECYTLDKSVTISKSQRPKFLNKLLNKLPHPNLFVESHFHYDTAFPNLKDGTTLQGYFQSEKYFSNIEKSIRQNFSLKNPLTKNSAKTKKLIIDTPVPVSLHLRRGDYVSDAKTQSTHGCTSQNFYIRSIDIITKIYGAKAKFFIFSDDPEYAKSAFSFCKNKYIVEGNNDKPYEDMYLMSCCEHNILANSSFSWWGAWLNENKQKIVIAPRQWFSRKTILEKSTADLFPDGWITL